MTRRAARPSPAPLLALALLLAGAGCSSPAEEGLPIGVLLPRTGQLADSGGHAEAAVLLAAERVNLAGGVAGKPITLVVKDTRSAAKPGLEAAGKLLDGWEVRGLIGPEEEDVAEGLVGLARERALVQISGGVSSPRFTTVADGGYFFRTCPSTQVTAAALARRMREDGVRSASLLYVPNDFGTAFISSAAVAFRGDGGAVVSPGVSAPLSVQAGERDYRALLTELLPLKPDALLLATDPITGARLVSDWKLMGGTGRLYLAPTLMTEVFVREVPAGALEGAVGVSALSGDPDGRFAASYSEAVGGAPSQSAYFYYDAMALMALALERAHAAAGEGAEPGGEQVRAALLEVASPPGEKFGWKQIDAALERVRAGQDVDYDGASGAIDFDANGDVTLHHVEFWTVEASSIVR